MLEYSHQFTSEDEHQKELKSVKTEFIKEDREKMRDPEPCRTEHTEDTEQQTGWSSFFSYQLGPIIERSTNISEIRTEPMLISWHCYCCEIQREAFRFCTEFSFINRSNGADTVCDNNYRITWCCGRNSQMLLPHSFQGLYNLLREKFKHFSETTQLFTAL